MLRSLQPYSVTGKWRPRNKIKSNTIPRDNLEEQMWKALQLQDQINQRQEELNSREKSHHLTLAEEEKIRLARAQELETELRALK